jgi:alkylation response protein AidB-like acyl-CoA dehydrogenase
VLERRIFSDEHGMFRGAFAAFCASEIAPHHAKWEEEGIVPRELWRAAGAQGFLCSWLPTELGGVGADFLFSVVITEELAKVGASGVAFPLHSDIVAPYIFRYGNDEQKRRWLPGLASGEAIGAIAMSEPSAGSDLAAIRTTARADGDHYVLDGQKTFVSNGILGDLVIVAVKTNPQADPPHSGVSLVVVERGTPGFERGRRLPKIGMKAQDTAEIFFSNCRVPRANLLGGEGGGFVMLMQQLAQERLIVAIGAQAGAEATLDMTMGYCRERHAFGKAIGSFQHSRFKLAEMASEVSIGREFIDRIVVDHSKGQDVAQEACMAKWWHTEMLKRVVDQCLQLYGGYGYMTEYPISKAYLDCRVQSIYAGTNEIMKEIIGRRLGF